jgi:hypothetical protein
VSEHELITREDLRRRLAVNATTRPVNLLVPVAVGAAAVVLGAWWLAVVAVACYAALVAVTFFDEEEAGRVGKRLYDRRRRSERRVPEVDPAELAEPIRERVEAALYAQSLIDETMHASDMPLDDMADEVDDLVAAMTSIAGHANRVHDYLDTRDPDQLRRRIATLRGIDNLDRTQQRTLAALQDQLRAIERLRENLNRFLGEMDHLVASLEAMHAQVVTMATAPDDVAREDVADQVRDLREQVTLMSDGVDEAFAETRVGGARPAVEPGS